jgi:hypothetical protein
MTITWRRTPRAPRREAARPGRTCSGNLRLLRKSFEGRTGGSPPPPLQLTSQSPLPAARTSCPGSTGWKPVLPYIIMGVGGEGLGEGGGVRDPGNTGFQPVETPFPKYYLVTISILSPKGGSNGVPYC